MSLTTYSLKCPCRIRTPEVVRDVQRVNQKVITYERIITIYRFLVIIYACMTEIKGTEKNMAMSTFMKLGSLLEMAYFDLRAFRNCLITYGSCFLLSSGVHVYKQQSGPVLTAVWSKAPPLTARCLSPLPGFESRPEKVASDLGLGGGFYRVLRFPFHHIQLASHVLATCGINVTKSKIQNQNTQQRTLLAQIFAMIFVQFICQ